MKRNVYDRQLAMRLIPILRSITREIRERTRGIDDLESRLNSASAQAGQDGRSIDPFEIQPALANHRRQLRLAKQELARLGCILDEDHPLRILIPGEDGTISGGFAWDAVDDSLQSSSKQTVN